MLICEVMGSVWATKKEEGLNGLKLMVVRQIDYFDKNKSSTFVAVDIVGAGAGDKVLVVNGSTARNSVSKKAASIDAAIVGIIDSIEVEKIY